MIPTDIGRQRVKPARGGYCVEEVERQALTTDDGEGLDGTPWGPQHEEGIEGDSNVSNQERLTTSRVSSRRILCVGG